MILHRLATELKEQNWVSVLVELVVVVVGIFLGLQADAWNEARKDRTRESAHLEQIYVDLGSNVDELKDLADSQADLASDLMFAIGVVMRGRIATDEIERFKWAILTAMRYPQATIQRAGYDTLIASGDLSILQDAGLRTQLVQLHATFDALPKHMLALLGGGPPRSPYSSDDVYAVPHPGGKGVLWKVDFEKVRSNPETLGYLASERRNHALVGRMYSEAADQAAEMRDYIGDLLKRQ